MEFAARLSRDTMTTADFYFPLESRPLLVFVDGRVHLGTAQMRRTKSYDHPTEERIQILELYNSYQRRKRDQLYERNRNNLDKLPRDLNLPLDIRIIRPIRVCQDPSISVTALGRSL